jgi:hypothetical protein
MRDAGVDVELILRRRSPYEGIQVGLTVTCEDPRRLRREILGLSDEQRAKHQYADAVRAFADYHNEDRFAEHVLAPYGRE